MLLNKAKNFVEMDPEDGYGDSIEKGIKLFGAGDHKNLEDIREWDAEK